MLPSNIDKLKLKKNPKARAENTTDFEVVSLPSVIASIVETLNGFIYGGKSISMVYPYGHLIQNILKILVCL